MIALKSVDVVFTFTEFVKQLVVFYDRYIFFHALKQSREYFKESHNRFAKITVFTVRLLEHVIIIMEFLAISNCRPEFFDGIADSIRNAVGLQYQREYLLG